MYYQPQPYPTFPQPPYFDPRNGRGPGYPDFGGGPGPFNPYPARGSCGDSRGVGVNDGLEPGDFDMPGTKPSWSRAHDQSREIIEQLTLCSRSLKAIGKRLADSRSDDRPKIAAEGLETISYCMGVLAIDGFSLPRGSIGDVMSNESEKLSRGDGCRQAGEFIDRMIEKYSRGSRGAGADIGEGVDKIGTCIRETRDNLGI